MCHKVTYRAAHKSKHGTNYGGRQVLLLLHLFQSDLLLGTSGLLPILSSASCRLYASNAPV